MIWGAIVGAASGPGFAAGIVRRGVRFVQVWHGQGQPWDNHDDLEVNHRRLAQQSDRPIAALLTDLAVGVVPVEELALHRRALDDPSLLWIKQIEPRCE